MTHNVKKFPAHLMFKVKGILWSAFFLIRVLMIINS